MQTYVLVMRLNTRALNPEQINSIREKWAVLIPQWTARGIFVTSNRIVQEGFVLSGAERRIERGAVAENNARIVSTINVLADSMEEAVELAKACPTLDYGGTVEVREAQPVPAPANEPSVG